MEILTCQQGTAEWYAARAGRITASRMGDVVNRSKRDGSKLTGYYHYAVELAVETLTGEPCSNVTAQAFAWGHKYEPHARLQYEIRTGRLCTEVGLVIGGDDIAASTDSLVHGGGVLEIKCPIKGSIHTETISKGAMPEEHTPQVQTGVWATKRDWCDFVSYDARQLDYRLQMYIERVYRDQAYINDMKSKLPEFRQLVQRYVDRLRGIDPDALYCTPDAVRVVDEVTDEASKKPVTVTVQKLVEQPPPEPYTGHIEGWYRACYAGETAEKDGAHKDVHFVWGMVPHFQHGRVARLQGDRMCKRGHAGGYELTPESESDELEAVTCPDCIVLAHKIATLPFDTVCANATAEEVRQRTAVAGK